MDKWMHGKGKRGCSRRERAPQMNSILEDSERLHGNNGGADQRLSKSQVGLSPRASHDNQCLTLHVSYAGK